MDKNTNMNRICGIDEFGRAVQTTNGKSAGKEVGLFYFLWLGAQDNQIYNINDLLAQQDKLWDPKSPDESPLWSFHYWGEPLFGYYKSKELFVIRKHVEMFIMAGIDYIVTDCTNAIFYPEPLYNLMKTLDEYRLAGWKVPKIACYTNSSSADTIRGIYAAFYEKKNTFPQIWYKPNGKPVIIGRVCPGELEKEIEDFFDIWQAQWPNEGYFPNGFPWMEWQYPQPLHEKFMSVSVAQHSKGGFVLCDGNWGRGFDHKGNENHDCYRLGQNFQSQWDTAIEKDAQNVFITGWNEWGAQKIFHENSVVFIDCFNEEYSRDIEPMKGGYNDAFYLQMIQNIRRFKKQAPDNSENQRKTIDVTGDVGQWEDISCVYEALNLENPQRNADTVQEGLVYKTNPATNNIQRVKVTHDDINIYFLIESQQDISQHQANRLNLFISAGTPKPQGWEGYAYVANRRQFGSLDKLNQSGNTISYCTTEYSISGKYMQIAIPRSMIGADGDCPCIYFKAADSVEKFRDINDYYVTGKCLPMGRLSYSYNL